MIRKSVLRMLASLIVLFWMTPMAFSAPSSDNFKKIERTINALVTQAKNDLAAMVELDLVKNSLGNVAAYDHARSAITLSFKTLPAYDQNLFRIFRAIHDSNKDYGFVYIGLKDGGFVQAPDNDTLQPGYTPALRPWYKEAIAGKGGVTLSSPYVSTNGHTTLSVNQKIMGKDGKPFGIAGIDLDLTAMIREYNGLATSPDAMVVILEKNGRTVISASRPDHTPVTLGNDILESLVAIAAKGDKKGRISLNDKTYTVQPYTASTLGWKVLVVFP